MFMAGGNLLFYSKYLPFKRLIGYILQDGGQWSEERVDRMSDGRQTLVLPQIKRRHIHAHARTHVSIFLSDGERLGLETILRRGSFRHRSRMRHLWRPKVDNQTGTIKVDKQTGKTKVDNQTETSKVDISTGATTADNQTGTRDGEQQN